MSKEKGLAELFAKIGNDNLVYQNLRNSADNVSRTREGDFKVTFYTDQITANDFLAGKGKIGLVVWVDQDVMAEAHSKLNEEAAND